MSAVSGLVLLLAAGFLCHQFVTVKTGPSNLSRRFLLRTEPCNCEHDCTCLLGNCVNNECHCINGWGGTDCGIQAYLVPTHKPVTTTSAGHVTTTADPSHVYSRECSYRGQFSGTHCECLYGFSGDRCQHPPETRHECSDPSCDHGICLWWLDHHGNRHQECHCDAEYTGNDCTHTNHPDGRYYLCADQTVCEHGHCFHNTKYNVLKYHACRCDDGWHGEHCDENHADNETILCAGKVCRHGICQRVWEYNHYQHHCKCDFGWNGPHCDNEVRHRCGDHLHCLHGQCLYKTYNNGYTYNHRCDCIQGWYGAECDQHISAPTVPSCNGRPCRKGTCLHDNTGDVCVCNNGWTGTECETALKTTTSSTTTPHTTATTTIFTMKPTTVTETTSPPPTTTLSTTSSPSTTSSTTTSSTTTSSTTTSSTRMVFTATSAPHPTSKSACNQSSVGSDLASSSHIVSPIAKQCSSGLHQSSEAFVLSNCQVNLDPSAWQQGSNVVALCNSSSPPLAYTPIATFENGVYSPTGGRSGVFLWCLNDGFEMAFQTCNSPVRIGTYVEGGAFTQDPTLYNIIQ